MKLLLVEDDDFLLNTYKIKFDEMKYEVMVAKDGEEALNILNSWLPDAIILDLMLPNMDGYQFLEIFKRTKQFEKIPVLVASNLGGEKDIKRAYSLGADDFLVKGDLSLRELVSRLNAIIKR